MTDTPINERAAHLLKILVECYIREGEPVGSSTLAEEAAVSLSSATIRTIMSDLEAQGYVRSPHTSAGRIPTAQGYRFFVNNLLTAQTGDASLSQQVGEQLQPDMNMQSLVKTASSLLSQITRLAALVTIPKRDGLSLRHIEFLPLSDNRVLVILVFNENELQNQIIYTKHPYTRSELQQAANYLNAKYVGEDLLSIRKALLTELSQDRENMDQMMRTAIEMANQAFDKTEEDPGYVVAGQSHLLKLADGANVDRLRQLFEAFSEKRQILDLMDQCFHAKNIQIYIGEESGYEILDDCSMVTAPYSIGGKVIGVLGVIGPTRMPYDRVIQTVDVTAKFLSAALNQSK